jgi:O-acetylserine/cysteine efflux transporter
MSASHTFLAILVAAIWGANFTVIRFGLDEFPPLLLAALRFVLAALPVLVIPRPQVAWRDLLLIGLFVFVGQFVFVFFAMILGMPPGLASLVMHTQGLITVLLAAIFLREHPLPRQWLGLGLAAMGLATIGLSSGGDLTLLGFGLTLAAAASWATGNLVMKRLGPVSMLGVTAWASLVPPLPLFLAGLLVDGVGPTLAAMRDVSWQGAFVLFYLTVPVTLFGYWIWGTLLRRYPAAAVAPFALLVPCFGMAIAALTFGEHLGGWRLAGVGLVLLGLTVAALPLTRWLGGKPRSAS